MLILRPFVAADLSVVEPWFDNLETRRWLGGRDWPGLTLRLQGPMRRSYFATLDEEPVGLLDCEQYEDKSASFAIVVSPSRRGLGLGPALVQALIALPCYADIGRFFVGVEPNNHRSMNLMQRAGFKAAGKDSDGFVCFEYIRP